MSISRPAASNRAKAATTAASSATSNLDASPGYPLSCKAAAAASSRAASTPLSTTRAPAAARPTAMALPRPRDEPVTSAVWPDRSKRVVDMSSSVSEIGAADDEVRALEDGGQQLDAEARALHRVHVSVLDARHCRHQLAVPALVEGAHRLLDQRVG